ncbi:HNH endonuclease signature motif containing protein [Geodermatophilus sp. SYSU D00705]
MITAALAALEGSTATPGAVDGLPITAGHVRELLARLDALGLRAPAGGSLGVAVTDAGGRLLATASAAQLARLARRGCPAHPGGNCGCPVLDRPPATPAYAPTAAQRGFVTTRDRGCRFPGCGQPVGLADLDHVVAHAGGGATDCANLCCLCRSHHRLKTFARGWRFVLDDDGTLHVTTPSGITRSTRPPGLRRDAPRAPALAPPSDEPPPQPPPPDHDPPPF